MISERSCWFGALRFYPEMKLILSCMIGDLKSESSLGYFASDLIQGGLRRYPD